MHVREVIPFRKSDEEMETKEREKKQNCGERGREAVRGRNVLRGAFTPSYRLLIICILHLSKIGKQLHIATTLCTCMSPHMICLCSYRWQGLYFTLHCVFILRAICYQKILHL